MKLNQALKVVNENRVHIVVEATKGHFERETLDYLSDSETFDNAQKFISKWRDKKVSFISFNKARNAIEIDCYMI